MMQTAHLREGDTLACRGRLDGAGLWTILVEREMGSGPVMILKIARQDVPQVTLVEADYVIHAFVLTAAESSSKTNGLKMDIE
jgi:hypothetical protein